MDKIVFCKKCGKKIEFPEDTNDFGFCTMCGEKLIYIDDNLNDVNNNKTDKEINEINLIDEKIDNVINIVDTVIKEEKLQDKVDILSEADTKEINDLRSSILDDDKSKASVKISNLLSDMYVVKTANDYEKNTTNNSEPEYKDILFSKHSHLLDEEDKIIISTNKFEKNLNDYKNRIIYSVAEYNKTLSACRFNYNKFNYLNDRKKIKTNFTFIKINNLLIVLSFLITTLLWYYNRIFVFTHDWVKYFDYGQMFYLLSNILLPVSFIILIISCILLRIKRSRKSAIKLLIKVTEYEEFNKIYVGDKKMEDEGK